MTPLSSLLPLLPLTLAAALSVCEYSQAGFHVLLDQSDIATSSGQAACQLQGWHYATVDSAEWVAAAETVGNCTSLSVGIESYNGMRIAGNECQYMQASGVFVLGMTAFECSRAGRLPVLCRDSAWSPKNLAPVAGGGAAVAKERTVRNAAGQEDFTVCEHSQDGLHMLFGPYEHGEAEEVCADHGWTLAALHPPHLTALDNVWGECSPMDATAWIAPLGALQTGLCHSVYEQGLGVFWYMVSEGDHPCSMGTGMILCQELSP